MSQTTTDPLRPVTDAINAIAAEVNLPLGLAADLMKAIADWGTYSAAKAARDALSSFADDLDSIGRPVEAALAREAAASPGAPL